MIDFNYNPVSEEEAQKLRYNLLPDGIYKGKVKEAERKKSYAGNPMGVFTLKFSDNEGNCRTIIDHIAFIPSMMWKARHFCESTDLINEFESKKFVPELALDKDVYARIKTEIGKEIPFDKLNGKPPGSRYPDKNVVEDYVKPVINDQEIKTEDLFDDVVPF